MSLKDYLLSVSHHLVKNDQFTLLPFDESIQLEGYFPPFELMKTTRFDLSFIRLVPVPPNFYFDQEEIAKLIHHSKTIFSQSGARSLKLFQLYVFESTPSFELQQQIQEGVSKIDETKMELFVGFVDLETKQMGFPEHVFSEIDADRDSFLSYLTDSTRVEEPQILIDEIESIENQRRKEIRNVFHYGKPYFSYILIAINALIYILMEVKGGSTDPRILLQFGAKESYLISQGEYWRFIAPIFLHIGFIHFALNNAALHYLGQLTERIYGSVRFVTIYLLAGIIGNIASFIFAPDTIGAGASGSIFGLFGALLYFGYVHPNLFFKTMGKDILTIIAINLIFGFTVNNIDNFAHIGGLVGGFFAASFVRMPNQSKKRWLMPILATGFLLLSFSTTWYFIENREVTGSQALTFEAEDAITGGDYKKAAELFQHLLKSNPNNASFHFYYAYSEDQLGNLNNAKEHYELAIENDAMMYQAHYNIARILLIQNKEAEASPYLEQAIKINPQFVEAKELLQQIQQ